MLRRLMHRVMTRLAPLSFNVLNVLLVGNLPPLGGACVILEDEGRFLLVVRSDGRASFPGGFIRWREHPGQAARRECKEETGLDVELQNTIGTYSNIGTHFFCMSTINVAFAGRIVDGSKLRGSVEGRPRWMTESEMRSAVGAHYSNMLDDYFAYRAETGPMSG